MGASIELPAINGHGRASNEGAIDSVEKMPQTGEYEILSADQRDTLALARLGKKPVLKVRRPR